MLSSPAAALRHLASLLGLLLCTAVLLSGCQSSPATRGGLSAAQIEGLRQAGFVETGTGWSLNLNGSILFDTDTDHLTAEARQIVNEVVNTLRLIDIDSVRVEGHTDNTGNTRYNEELAARRAEAVARQFVTEGMTDHKVIRRSFGSRRPIADNRNSSGRAQNRRVAVIVPAS